MNKDFKLSLTRDKNFDFPILKTIEDDKFCVLQNTTFIFDKVENTVERRKCWLPHCLFDLQGLHFYFSFKIFW